MSEFEKNAAILELAAQRDMLLEALEAVTKALEAANIAGQACYGSPVAVRARAAIFKARGEAL